MTGPRKPQAIQVWAWPMTVQPNLDRSAVGAVPVRIGDAERDRAMSDLGDHFAAGRLTREEFDARVDQAMAARFDRDLQPLFVDLPRSEPVPGRPAGPPQSLHVGWPLLLWWLPLLLVGTVVMLLLLGAPWLIWTFCWVLLISAFWGRRRPHHHHYHRYR